MSGTHETLITPLASDHRPRSGELAKRNGVLYSLKTYLLPRGRPTPPGSKSPQRRPSGKYKPLIPSQQASTEDPKSDVNQELIAESSDQLQGAQEILKLLKALPLLLIIEKAKGIRVFQNVQELKQRLTSASGRVKQHEAKLRRILSKLGQLDLDVYDLQDPDDVHRLHQNWKNLYDEIEAWLGGPEAAMTSDSSDTE